MIIEKILVAITFYYAKDRLNFLKTVCSQIPNLGFLYKVFIITNTHEESEIELINQNIQCLSNYEIVKHLPMGHPYFLPWGHLPIFKQQFILDPSISHFMYLEDDIEITPKNITYWLRGRNELLEFGLYPSFLRIEKNSLNNNFYATDITSPLKLRKLPKIKISSDYYYLSSPQPYQGMYLMDREMLKEYLQSPATSPDFGSWGIREKATQALTFINIPDTFFSRNLLGYRSSINRVDKDALIRHLPDNYANDPKSQFGKVLVDKLIRI